MQRPKGNRGRGEQKLTRHERKEVDGMIRRGAKVHLNEWTAGMKVNGESFHKSYAERYRKALVRSGASGCSPNMTAAVRAKTQPYDSESNQPAIIKNHEVHCVWITNPVMGNPGATLANVLPPFPVGRRVQYTVRYNVKPRSVSGVYSGFFAWPSSGTPFCPGGAWYETGHPVTNDQATWNPGANLTGNMLQTVNAPFIREIPGDFNRSANGNHATPWVCEGYRVRVIATDVELRDTKGSITAGFIEGALALSATTGYFHAESLANHPGVSTYPFLPQMDEVVVTTPTTGRLFTGRRTTSTDGAAAPSIVYNIVPGGWGYLLFQDVATDSQSEDIVIEVSESYVLFGSDIAAGVPVKVDPMACHCAAECLMNVNRDTLYPVESVPTGKVEQAARGLSRRVERQGAAEAINQEPDWLTQLAQYAEPVASTISKLIPYASALV